MTAPSCPHGVAWGLGPCDGCREAAGGAQVVPVGVGSAGGSHARLEAAGWVLHADGYWAKGALRMATLEALEAEERGVKWDRATGTVRPRRKPGRRGKGLVERSVWVEPEVWERWKAEAEAEGVGVGGWLVSLEKRCLPSSGSGER